MFTRFVNSHRNVVVVEQDLVCPLLVGTARTMYSRIAAPPSDTGAANVTDTEASPAVATKLLGAPGVKRSDTETADDSAPEPAALTALNFTL